jgi:hypothetical protein
MHCSHSSFVFEMWIVFGTVFVENLYSWLLLFVWKFCLAICQLFLIFCFVFIAVCFDVFWGCVCCRFQDLDTCYSCLLFRFCVVVALVSFEKICLAICLPFVRFCSVCLAVFSTMCFSHVAVIF